MCLTINIVESLYSLRFRLDHYFSVIYFGVDFQKAVIWVGLDIRHLANSFYASDSVHEPISNIASQERILQKTMLILLCFPL